MKQFQIVIDSREQHPLPIPEVVEWLDPTALPTSAKPVRVRIGLDKRALPAADYILEGDVGLVYTTGSGRGAGVVERKASIDELSDNVFAPHRRPNFITLLTRMKEQWRYPVLMIEGGLSTLFQISRKHPGGLVIDGLQRLSMEYGVPIIPLDGRGLSQRKYAGEWVARWLLNATVAGGFNGTISH